MVIDDRLQPFGPSARMRSMKKSNGRFERNWNAASTTRMKAVDAVNRSYRNGTLISEIEKAFRGAMGVDSGAGSSPRMSITAVDDIIGKDLLEHQVLRHDSMTTAYIMGAADNPGAPDDALHLEVQLI